MGASKWLRWPRAVGGALVALSLAYALSVSAQTQSADAGAATTDAASSTTTLASSGDAAAGPADTASMVSTAPVPTFAPHAPLLPPPTPEQLAA